MRFAYQHYIIHAAREHFIVMQASDVQEEPGNIAHDVGSF